MIDEDSLLPSEEEQPDFAFATVAGVDENGVSLIFDGAGESGGKLYKVNSTVIFRPGDRVAIRRDSGTVVVEFPVGAPGSRFPLPKGGKKGQALLKGSDADYDATWGDAGGSSGGLPSGGAAGKFLRKKSAADGDAEWADPEVSRLAANASFGVQIGTNGVIQSINNNQPSLGSSTYGKQFKDVYTSGGTLSLGAAKLGFFGTTPIARKTLSASATLSQLIQALKDYGLFS